MKRNFANNWDFKIHYKWFHDFEIEQKLSKTFCFLHINMTTPENEITTEHTFFFIPEQYFVWILIISYTSLFARFLFDTCFILYYKSILYMGKDTR